MNTSVKRRPVPFDLLAVALVLLLAALVAFRFYGGKPVGAARLATVSINGEVVDSFDLSAVGATRTYTNNGYTLTVQTEEFGLRVIDSDCPNRDCVHRGLIDRGGESIVCLPARIIISLTADEGGIDAVLG